MPIDDGLDELSAEFTAAGVQNELYHDCIHIRLLDGQRWLEIKAWVDGERSAQILGGAEQQNFVPTAKELEGTPKEVVARLLGKLEACGVHHRVTP